MQYKFRGLKKDKSGWIYGIPTFDMLHIFNAEQMDSPNNYEVIPKTVGQFTGLQDKNGKDVYRGDVFEAIYRERGHQENVVKVKATVVFKFGRFMVEMMHPQDKCLVCKDLYDFLKNEQKVVIGNIYQNTKILK